MIIKRILLIALGLVLAQCSDDIENLNVNEKSFNDVPGEPLMTNGQRELVDQLVNTNVNTNVFRLFAQQWSEATYVDETRYNIRTRSIPQSHWEALYVDVLKDMNEAAVRINAQEILNVSPAQFEQDTAVKANKLAIIEIQSVMAYQILVDTFGDIPYTEALDVDIINPTYEDDTAIYMDLISRLNTALGNLNTEYGGFGGQDLIYLGDTSSWLTFGNSIKMRMAMRISDVDPEMAQTMISDVADNIIVSNDQNAVLQYQATTPNTNPLWVDLVQSNRKDFVPADTFVNALNDLEDPRRDVFFADPIDGEYIGGTYGSTVQYASFSHLGDAFFQPDLPGDIFDAAEGNFLLAEAVERGFVSGSAEEYYDAAITANMEYWGVSADDTAAYLAKTHPF